MKEKTKQKIKKITLDVCIAIVVVVLILGVFKLAASAAETEPIFTYAACSHEYTNGICTKCGFSCPHQNIGIKGNCLDCLWVCAAGHNLNEVGICRSCGLECPHNHTTEIVEHDGVLGHRIYAECTDCGYYWLKRADPHLKNEICICRICWYVCHVYDGGQCLDCGKKCTHEFLNGFCVECRFCNGSHSYKYGICEECGYSCTHSIIENIYVSNGSSNHICTTRCADCKISLYVSTAPHTLNGDACKYCDYVEPYSCPHSNTENVYVSYGLSNHSYITRCTYCKASLQTKSTSHTYEGDVCIYCGFVKPHIFLLNPDGTCYICDGCKLDYPAKLVSDRVDCFSDFTTIAPSSLGVSLVDGDYYDNVNGVTYRRFLSNSIIPSDANNSGNFGFLIDLGVPNKDGNYKYAIIKMRTNLPVGNDHTFWRFVVNFGSGDKNIRFDKYKICSGEWVTYVVDLSAFNAGNVPENINKFQLMDFYGQGILKNNSYEGYYVDVSYASIVDDLHDVLNLLDTEDLAFSTSYGSSTVYSEQSFSNLAHTFVTKCWATNGNSNKTHYWFKQCEQCGLKVDDPRGTKPHIWTDPNGVNAGRCRECWILCIHEWSNGVCTNCGYACYHDAIYVKEFVFYDTTYHKTHYACLECDYFSICNDQHLFSFDGIQGNNVDDYKCEHCKHYVITAENYYNIGYNKGLVDGADMDSGSIAQGMIFGIYDGMTNTFFSMLNYDIFGINIANLIMSLIVVAIVIFIIKKVM